MSLRVIELVNDTCHQLLRYEKTRLSTCEGVGVSVPLDYQTQITPYYLTHCLHSLQRQTTQCRRRLPCRLSTGRLRSVQPFQRVDRWLPRSLPQARRLLCTACFQFPRNQTIIYNIVMPIKVDIQWCRGAMVARWLPVLKAADCQRLQVRVLPISFFHCLYHLMQLTVYYIL